MRSMWLVLGVLAAGCTTEDGPAGASVPIALDDYCEVMAGDTCRCQRACGCEARTPSCDDEVAQCRVLLDGMRGLIAAGSTTYDGMAVRRLADRIAAASCDQDMFAMLGYRGRDQLDFGGVFRGRLPPGSGCSLQSLTPGDDTGDPLGASVECAGGLCVSDRCVELRDVGEPCDETVRCFDFSVERWDQDREMRVECSGTCLSLKAVGEACSDPGECVTARCDGMCVAPAGTGAPCTSSTGCSSFECDPATGCGVTDLPMGAPCTRRFECASDACEGGACVAPACSPDVM